MKATRPLKLLLLTLLTAAVAVLTSTLGPRSLPFVPHGFPGPVLALELVDSPKQFHDLVEQWAQAPAGYASELFWRGTAADLGFIAAYAWLFIGLLIDVQKAASGRWLRSAGVLLIAVAAVADYAEDYFIIEALGRTVPALPPPRTWPISAAATVKWAVLGLGLLTVAWRFQPDRGFPRVLRAAHAWLMLGYAAAAALFIGGALFHRPMWIGGGVLPLAMVMPVQAALFAWAAWTARRHYPAADPTYTTSIDDVRAKELEYIGRRRQRLGEPVPDVATVSSSLVGLAMSGGGIRSATTNLGTLQALSRMGLLPLVDYVCTVSGGGYIGACLTSLLSIKTNQGPPLDFPPGDPRQYRYGDRRNLMFGTNWLEFPFNPDMQPAGVAGPGACAPAAVDSLGKQIVAHLRTHGSFLIARRGIFKRDALRAVGHILTGTVYHLLTTFVIFITIALVLMAAARLLEPDLDNLLKPSASVESEAVATVTGVSGAASYEVTQTPPMAFGSQLWHRLKQVGAAAWSGLGPGGLWRAFVGGTLVSLLVLAWFIFAARWWWARDFPSDWKAGETREDRFHRIVMLVAVNTVGVAAIGVPVFCIYLAPANQPRRGLLVAPLLVLAGARVANFALYPILARADGADRRFLNLWNRQFRSLWNTFQAVTTYGVVATLLFALLPIVAYTLWALLDTGPSPWSLLAPGLSLLAGRLLTGESGVPKIGGRALPAGLVHFVLGLAAAVFIGFVVIATATGAVWLAAHDSWNSVHWLLLAAAVLLILLSLAGNINKISPHYFYRDRLIETYLRTEVRGAHHRMETLTDTMAMPLTSLHGEDPSSANLGNDSPYLLISAAINLAGSRDLTRKDRKSGHFLFSKYFCGSRQTGYRRTEHWRDGETKLGRAMTISGAAAGTAMGYHTFFGQSFFTAIFNLRLGFWMLNPKHASGTDDFAFWPYFMLQEAFAATSERTRLVNLSDGGHTGDNVGIYPLLERRCQVIIAVDAEADASLSFGSFTEALRQAYVDLGVDIDIDLSLIRPHPETGLSKSHCAVGRVRYPECPDRPNWIVYLKNSMTGDEPAPILNYKSRCSAFPHETTADQFFDDAQFESYRSLGDHITADTFERWLRSRS